MAACRADSRANPAGCPLKSLRHRRDRLRMAFTMKASCGIVSWLAALLLLAGCGKTDRDGVLIKELSPRHAIRHLEKAYAGADATTLQHIREIAAAQQARDWERAVLNVLALQAGAPQATFEQAQAVQALMNALQLQIAEAADQGDQKALRAGQMLRATAPGGR